jgi:hypothetical protein
MAWRLFQIAIVVGVMALLFHGVDDTTFRERPGATMAVGVGIAFLATLILVSGWDAIRFAPARLRSFRTRWPVDPVYRREKITRWRTIGAGLAITYVVALAFSIFAVVTNPGKQHAPLELSFGLGVLFLPFTAVGLWLYLPPSRRPLGPGTAGEQELRGDHGGPLAPDGKPRQLG